jgi:Amidohydrolase family
VAWLEHPDCHGESARAFWPTRSTPVRHRVEHIETVPDHTVRRFARLGVAASMQPLHCTEYTRADHTDNWSRRLGDQRASRAWRCRDLRESGARVILGSDWPIAPHPPDLFHLGQARRFRAQAPRHQPQASSARPRRQGPLPAPGGPVPGPDSSWVTTGAPGDTHPDAPEGLSGWFSRLGGRSATMLRVSRRCSSAGRAAVL